VPQAPRGTDFGDDLFEKILRSVSAGEELRTLSQGRPNRIVSIDRNGVYVTTQRSEGLGTGPQLVPAWMFVRAWDQLTEKGSLTQEGLKHALGVNRSVFVCALLATFDDVEVESRRPTKLRRRR
jgi:antitoxin (DNA-binding transcriptional repressor) of toxin-antitoxin stability system